MTSSVFLIQRRIKDFQTLELKKCFNVENLWCTQLQMQTSSNMITRNEKCHKVKFIFELEYFDICLTFIIYMQHFLVSTS